LTHASGLVSARQDGVLRRWRLTPLPVGGYFAGRIAATVLLPGAGAAVVILVGVAMAGLHLDVGASVSLLAALITGALAIVVPTAEAAFPVIGLTYLPVLFLSGVFGAFRGEPAWLATAVHYLPAQPLIDAVTSAMRHVGGGLVPLPGCDLAILAAWGAAGLLISVRFFRWNPQRPAHSDHQTRRRADPTGR
jgi:ABC-2 type transport system permease protein